MGEENKREPFRFLSDWEFSELTSKDKAAYLSRASQELEQRQRALKAQIQTLQGYNERQR
jgi:hypothetical protein